MSSTFSTHYTDTLASSFLLSPAGIPDPPNSDKAHVKDVLHSLVLSLKPPYTEHVIRNALDSLKALHVHQLTSGVDTGFRDVEIDSEEIALTKAALGKILVGIYANTLDLYLSEASTVENEALWWAEIEQSRVSAAIYLLQTLPIRLVNMAKNILHILRTQNIPLRPSAFYPSSLRRLFPSRGFLLPNTLTASLFPHLLRSPANTAYSASRKPPLFSEQPSHRRSTSSTIWAIHRTIQDWVEDVSFFVDLPLHLAQQECQFKRKALENICDERAEVLGRLLNLRPKLAFAFEEGFESSSPTSVRALMALFANFANALEQATSMETAAGSKKPPTTGAQHEDVLGEIEFFHSTIFESHKASHRADVLGQHLSRPSRMTLLWPRLLLLPPLTLYLVRYAYASRASLVELARGTVDTMNRFFRDWLLEPVKGVVKTIRAGTEEGMIVTKEGVAADRDSLERMTLALARDKLQYDAAQLNALALQIRLGDLTPVLRIYEEDIKNPVKSAISGTLLRSVFVQVQKAKVDIDQALAGIDKLLKSQELTFAFVGVAPAFAVVYVVVGFLRDIWLGGRGRGKHGGRRKRTHVWHAMRRIERLLVLQPKSRHHPHQRRSDDPASVPSEDVSAGAIPPLTAGLLLLSVTHLRTYAETVLPPRSRLREGFLEDVQDLEDPTLGRAEKLRVLDRMWRSWGGELGWGQMGSTTQ